MTIQKETWSVQGEPLILFQTLSILSVIQSQIPMPPPLPPLSLVLVDDGSAGCVDTTVFVVVVVAGESDCMVEVDDTCESVGTETPILGILLVDEDNVDVVRIELDDGEVVERVCASTGSGGVSIPAESPLSCSPIGRSGRRTVPLFAMGVNPTESHRILYTSIFSATTSAIQSVKARSKKQLLTKRL